MTIAEKNSLTDAEIAAAVTAAYTAHRSDTGGANASYIPYLASVDSSLFAVAVVTVDGSVHVAGDAHVDFAIESISKLTTMALAMSQVGIDAFHSKVGADPTGMAFNSVMALEMHSDLPLSPMVNAGAMASTSLVVANDAEDRWRQILKMQGDFTGRDLQMSDVVNDSEQETNFHNRAIAWLLYGGGAMHCDPMEAVEIYTRQCSTMISAVDLATMGATLAFDGVNPVTGATVVDSELVPHLLAEMMMEGMYTRSGDWAYTVGLPGKSGVGGGVVAVAPGQLAIAAFSPPLDEAGNSVRAQAAIADVATALGLGLFRSGSKP
ncbi:glutaminase A [Microbacterium sp. NPDC076911]|uniref:glutaminase A n=1 Tax=Microbacterium sp. NPDC076911 TaxID=3154958 RepID=UPI003438965F